MKINESTSVSLKVIISALPLIIGFCGWMYKIDTSVSSLKKTTSSIKRSVDEISRNISIKLANNKTLKNYYKE